MKHVINPNHVDVYAFEHHIASSFGKGSSKMLVAEVTGRIVSYTVKECGEVYGRYNDLAEACQNYNELP